MATKTAFPESRPNGLVYETPNEIVLEIEGLTDNGNGTFTLRGVNPINLDHENFEDVVRDMTDKGVPRSLAIRLAEEASESIYRGLLADAIAQRARRVG